MPPADPSFSAARARPRARTCPVRPARPRWQWAAALLLGGCSAAAGALVLAAAVYVSTLDLPNLHDPAAFGAPQATVLYAADGTREVARYYREHRLPVAYHAIAPAVIGALVATEGHRLYEHAGVDVFRVASAAAHTLAGDRQGGSTITMQLVRNRYASVARAAPRRRKLMEVLMALRLERAYSKREIVEMYLNTVSFGRRAFGIEAAAHVYFGKEAATLTVPEAATLVGLLKATSHYDPVRHPERARARRNTVLRQMVRRGMLEEAAARRFRREPVDVHLHSAGLSASRAPHFAEHVRRWLERWAATHGHDLFADGLRVYTTLDASLQRYALAAVREQMPLLQTVAAYEWSRPQPHLLARTPAPYRRRRGTFEPFAHLWTARPDILAAHVPRGVSADSIKKNVLKKKITRLQAGLVALDPRTGHVRAWVGSRDFFRDAYDHVAMARRQPGSTFKPFVYTAALDRGYAPGDALEGGRIRRSAEDVLFAAETPDAPSGPVITLRDGLAYSSNAVARRLARELGAPAIARMARRLGVQSDLRAVPSLALGTSEVTLLEMASAYATLAGGGHYRAPVVVTRIEDGSGHVLYRHRPAPRKAISSHVAYAVVDMMRGVIDRGTGRALRRTFGLTADLAGKTGTTQHNADGWFLAMRPDLVAGAWVGFNDRRVHFRTEHWGRGGSNALRVVGAFLRHVLDEPGHRSAARFEPPPGYREAKPLREAFAARPRASSADTSFAPLPMPDAFAQGLRRTRSAPPADRLTRQAAGPGRTLRRALAAPAVPNDTPRVHRPDGS